MNPRIEDVSSRRIRRLHGRTLRIPAVVLAVVALAACGTMMTMLGHHSMAFDLGAKPASEAEYGFDAKLSEGGLYRVGASTPQPIRVGRIHALRLQVETADGRAVEDAAITVDGGMPDHGHGLPTRPEVTENLGGGAYTVEGMKYNMGGWWVVRVEIASPLGTDTVLFNLSL